MSRSNQHSKSYGPRPYTIDVDPSRIEAIRQRVAAFRPSQEIDQPAWTDGPPSSEMASLARYWAEEYDWSALQSHMNELDHFMTTVPAPRGNYTCDLDIHFIHQRSPRADAIPMLMIHGWPSTSFEWQKLIPALVDPKDPKKQAFHIIAPDLPGYGFSPAPSAPGLGPDEHARAFATLMEQLSYDKYAIYSTDIGVVVALAMTNRYESRILNHICDVYMVLPTPADIARLTANETIAEETTYISAVNAFFNAYSAYATLHSTLPLSVAHALDDSPVGFLAWMYQLWYTISDKPAVPSQLVTEALLLYLPGVYGHIRSYRELMPALATLTAGDSGKRSRVPTSVLQFGGSTGYPGVEGMNFVPREWIERSANVTYFARHDAGGHFPALSEPALVLEDIHAVFA